MPGMLVDYTYNGTNGDTYKGQVVSDTTNPKYTYTPGQTYQAPNGGGTYTISTTPGTPTNSPSGAVYQSSYYDKQTNTNYDSYKYDIRDNQYYDVNTNKYDPSTGTYTPPPTTPGGTSTPVPMWSGIGLGNEYSYIKSTSGQYHVYGGGSYYANLNPSNTYTNTAYDYKFMYPDGSYYTGHVVDDGTFGYKPGSNYTRGDSTYAITGVHAGPVAPTAMAGYNYVDNYHDMATNTDYMPSDLIPNTPYYQKPVGYGGLGTENDYIQKAGSYYALNDQNPPGQNTPLTAIPLPT